MAVRRPLLVAVLAGLLVLAVVALIGVTGGTRGAGRSDAPRTGASSTTPPATGQVSREAAGRPAAGDAAGRDSDAGSAATPGSSAAPDSSATHGNGSEQPVREVAEHPGSTPTTLPGLKKAARAQRASEAELAESFPALQARRGSLAPRHPGHTIPVPGAAEIGSSSISSEGDISQVALVLRLPGSVDRALRFYRIRLGRVGFAEGSAPAVASGAGAAFRRGPDHVVVTASRTGGATQVTVYATLRTGG